MTKGRCQHQDIREAHHHHHHEQQQLEQGRDKAALSPSHERHRVKSAMSGRCSSVYDVTERDDGDDDVKLCSQSDVISTLRHASSSISSLCRPLYIHRPLEDAGAPLQLEDARRLLGVDERERDYRLHAVVEEPRHGWLAHRRHQLGSVQAGGSVSWRTAGFGDDEVGSSGDSACCGDDDVSDGQMLVGQTSDSQAQRHDVTSDDTTPLCARSESNHYQPPHSRRPGFLFNAKFIYSINRALI